MMPGGGPVEISNLLTLFLAGRALLALGSWADTRGVAAAAGVAEADVP